MRAKTCIDGSNPSVSASTLYTNVRQRSRASAQLFDWTRESGAAHYASVRERGFSVAETRDLLEDCWRIGTRNETKLSAMVVRPFEYGKLFRPA